LAKGISGRKTILYSSLRNQLLTTKAGELSRDVKTARETIFINSNLLYVSFVQLYLAQSAASEKELFLLNQLSTKKLKFNMD